MHAHPLAARARRTVVVLGILTLAAVVGLLFTWGQSTFAPARAASPGPGMSLDAPPTVFVGEPFVLTVNTNPAPDVAILGFAAEVLFPIAPELGQCDNIRDDDGDLAVNDGCPQVGPVAEGQCGNALDDDEDGAVNDGCPQVSDTSEADLELAECANETDDDGDGVINDGCPHVGASESGADCTNALDDDNDGFVNDGCPQVGAAGEGPCTNAVDDDDDGAINDGCPADGAPEQATAKAPNCINTLDDDGDSIVNDGCPQVGDTAEGELEFCTNAIDDDGDGFINDGCPQAGNLAETGDQCTNDTDDDQGGFDFDGLINFDGHINDGCPVVGPLGEDPCANALDDDGDGFPNDGCPAEGLTEATGCDGSADDDRDGAPNDGCPQQGGTAEAGTLCADSIDDDGDGVVNDGCPFAGFPESARGDHCANDIDDDDDGRVNDGCPPAGAELIYSGSGQCQDEIEVARVDGEPIQFCLSLLVPAGGRYISVATATHAVPLPPLNVPPGAGGVALATFNFTCYAAGSYKLTLTASPPPLVDPAAYSGFGSLYANLDALPVHVKTVKQDYDANFDGTPETHQVADTLVITCVEPPPTPPPIGGIGVIPEIAAPRTGSADAAARGNGGILAGAIVAVTAGALALGGAAWYARRPHPRS